MELRLIHDRAPFFACGPLGCFDVGQKLDIHGSEVLVVNIDHDGAGVAVATDYLGRYAVEKGLSKQEVLEHFSDRRSPSCKPYDTANARQHEQITNMILANRRKHGLSESDPRAKSKEFSF